MTNSHEYVLLPYLQGGADEGELEGEQAGDPEEKEHEPEEEETRKVLPDVVAEGGNRWWEEEMSIEKVQELIKKNLTSAERRGSKKRRAKVN